MASLTEEEMEELISEEPPPPLIMEPDAVQAPEKKVKRSRKKEKVEKPKKVEQKVAGATRSGKQRSSRRRERSPLRPPRRDRSRVRRRRGSPAASDLPGGSGDGSAASQTTCLAQVDASIRGRTPAMTSLGPATVSVSILCERRRRHFGHFGVRRQRRARGAGAAHRCVFARPEQLPAGVSRDRGSPFNSA